MLIMSHLSQILSEIVSHTLSAAKNCNCTTTGCIFNVIVHPVRFKLCIVLIKLHIYGSYIRGNGDTQTAPLD